MCLPPSSTFLSAIRFRPAVQLRQGAAGPTPGDAVWNRRQFSAIWAPLPGSYNFASSSYALRPIVETSLEADAPFCYDSYSVAEEQQQLQYK